MKVTKLHRNCEFEQSPWFGTKLIIFKADQRAKAKTKFEKLPNQLMISAFYGKLKFIEKLTTMTR